MEIILVLKFRKKPFKNFKLSKKKVKVRDPSPGCSGMILFSRKKMFRHDIGIRGIHRPKGRCGHRKGNTEAVRGSLVKVLWKNMLHIIWPELISWKRFFKKEILKI